MVGVPRLRISPAAAEGKADLLNLPFAFVAEMLAHVEAGYPNEACGVLAGRDGQAIKHFPAANASATPRTFSEIGPQELLAIWNEIEANDWHVLAYYHSHPETEAYPSPRDVRLARNWPGTFYIIFSLTDRQQPIVRAFLIEDETVREYRIIADE